MKRRELEGSSFKKALTSAAMMLDGMVRDKNDIVNSHAGEQCARAIYGNLKGTEKVKKRSDWQQPKGQRDAKWRSKVNMKLISLEPQTEIEKEKNVRIERENTTKDYKHLIFTQQD